MSTSLNYREKILNEIKDIPDDQITSLMKIIRIFKESIIHQREYDFALKEEFEEWDTLSDESLVNFEGAL